MGFETLSIGLIERETGELAAHGVAPKIGPSTLWHTYQTDTEEGGLSIPPFKVSHREAIDAWVIVVTVHLLTHEQEGEVPYALDVAARLIRATPLDDMYVGSVQTRPAPGIPNHDQALDQALEVLRGLGYRLEVGPNATTMHTHMFAELSVEYGVWEGPGKPEDE